MVQELHKGREREIRRRSSPHNIMKLTSMDVQFVEELLDLAIDQSVEELGNLLRL